MAYKISDKITALIVLIAFTFTFALPTQQIAYAQSMREVNRTKTETAGQKAQGGQKAEPQTGLGKLSVQLSQSYGKLKSALDNKETDKFRAALTDLKEIAKDFKKLLAQESSSNNRQLKKLNAKNALERQKKFDVQMQEKINTLNNVLESFKDISAATKTITETGDLGILKEKVEALGKVLCPEQQEMPLGDTLPHNNADIKPQEPVTGTGIMPAYMAAAEGKAVSGLPKTPAAEDLSENSEVKFTKEIKELADSLNTSVNIYEYVRNNVNFEPYYGSRKGAAGTLQQMTGNDFDQASLLISLLRYKGIPARYIRGTVEIPVEKVMGWTGAETPEASVKALGSLGIPTVSMVSGGKITAVRTEHVWVEAYVPYENYRGIGSGKGKKIWVPLDPSFKQNEKKRGLDIEGITGVSRQEIESVFGHSGTVSADNDAISRISTDMMGQKLAEQKAAIEDYMDENDMQDPDWYDIFGGYEIIAQKLGLLPLTLPFKTVSVLGEYQSIGIEFKDTLTFSIAGADPYGLNFGETNDFEYIADASQIYGKKLTLSWTGATGEDDAVINQYGGIFKTPAYMVQLKPVLKADGTVVATGKPVGMGYRQQFTIALKVPGQSGTEKVVNPVTAGSYYCVGLDYGTIAPDELKGVANKLKELQASVSEQNIYSDEAMGEILNAVVKTYFGQLDIYNRMLADQFQVKSSRLISEGMTGYNADVKYIFMMPVELSEGSMFIDVDRDVHGVVSLNGDRGAEKAFMLSSGIMSSTMEHAIFEQMFNTPSVSAIKVLSEANNMGIPVYTVDESNISTVLPKLEVSSSVKTDIANAVNAGKKVTVPQRNIRYFDWTGTGYVVLDTVSGAAAYMISGGTAGGSMSVGQMLSEYIDTVIQGVLFIVMIELAEAIAVALFPGVGWIAGAFMAVKVALMAMYIINLVYIAEMYAITGDVYYLQELIVQLAAFVTLGLISKPLFEQASRNIEMVERMKAAEKSYYDHNKSNGYSDETSTDYWQKYGSNNMQKARDALDTLKNEGVSDENVSRAGKNLDSDGIESYKDTIKDNTGKFDSADETELLEQFEKCKNKAEMENLRDSVDELEETGINPKEYSELGIDSPEFAERMAGNAEEASQYIAEKGQAQNEPPIPDSIDPVSFADKVIDGKSIVFDDANGVGYLRARFFFEDLTGNSISSKVPNFKGIDDLANREAISCKTYDTRPGVKTNGDENLGKNIIRDIKKLFDFDRYQARNSKTGEIVTVETEYYDTKVLRIGIPDQPLTPKQFEGIKSALDFAKNNLDPITNKPVRIEIVVLKN